MLLSIGMIVKNEEKNLQKCLEALMPLKEKLGAELIIADTGSTDKTVEIAEKFADKVIPFEWCDDFAAARNVSLNASTGEWYMFLDADEFFVEWEGIADFFLSGEYKKYNSATFVINNLASSDGVRSSYFNAPRLTKRTPETTFLSPIHEYLSTYSEPIMFLPHAVADHTGYMHETNSETGIKKFNRNKPLIEKELREKPDRTMLYLQFAEAHSAIGKFDEALEIIDKGIKVSAEKGDRTICGLYLRKAEIFIQKKNYEKAIAVIDEYLAIPKGDTGIDLEFLGQKAHHLFLLRRYTEAVKTYNKYAQYYKEYNQGKHHTVDTMLVSSNFSRPDVYADSMFNAVIACVNCNKFNTARSLLNTVPYKFYLDNPNRMQGRLKQELIVMRGMKNFSGAAKSYLALPAGERAMFLSELTNHIAHRTDGTWILQSLQKQKFPEGMMFVLGVYSEVRTHDVPPEKMVEYMRRMKEESEKTPEILPLVTFVINEAESQSSAANRSEFEYLAAQAKKNIRMLIAGGESVGAERLLREYERLCPKDEDIPEMKKDLGIGVNAPTQSNPF